MPAKKNEQIDLPDDKDPFPLEEIRRRLALCSLKDVARAAGVSPASLYRLTNKKKKWIPSWRVLAAVSDLFRAMGSDAPLPIKPAKKVARNG